MRILLVLGVLLMNLPCSADPYLLFRENDKIGIKDEAGKVVIPATFDALGWSDGSFSVVAGVTGYKMNTHWGLINLKKEFLTKPEYEQLTWSGGDRIIVQKKINAVKYSVGCLDLRGKVVVPFRYDGIKINGLRGIVFVQERGRYHYGLIDLNGAEVIPARYDGLRPIGTNRYLVENSSHKMALVSETGKSIVDFQIDSISKFRDGYAVLFQNSLAGIINTDGELVAEAKYAEVKRKSDGAIDGRMPDVWNILSGENKILRQFNADQLLPIDGKMYRVAKGNLYGFVDAEFKTILPIDYNWLGDVANGVVMAAKKNRFGLIKINGRVMIPFEFDSIARSQMRDDQHSGASGHKPGEDRLLRVRKDSPGKRVWMLYDTVGVRKTEKDYDFIDAFNGVIYPVRKGNYSGALDRYGKEVIQCVYDSLFEQTNDMISVRFMGQYGIISTEEKWILTPQNQRAHPLQRDLYWEIVGSTFFLKSLSGVTIYFTDNKIQILPDGLLETSADGSEKRIDFQGRIMERTAAVQIAQPEKIFPASEGLRGIKKDGKYGFVDDRGRLRIANRYEGIGLFKEGLAPVKILNRWGYINHAENIVVQPVYDRAEDFSDGHARVGKGNRYGIIDKEGKLLVALRYDSIVQHRKSYFILYSGKLAGLADAQGRILVDTRYDSIQLLENGYCLISRDGKFGLITTQGMSTIPLWYDHLVYDKARNEFVGVVRSSWKPLVAGLR